jgi:hypothetical protein
LTAQREARGGRKYSRGEDEEGKMMGETSGRRARNKRRKLILNQLYGRASGGEF